MLAQSNRLRKHAEYVRVYGSSKKQFSKQMSFFFSLRPAVGPDGKALRGTDAMTPRVGLTVGKVLGKAVDRNRIKRRLRAVARKHLGLLSGPVDVILHPRRSVMELEQGALEREVRQVFRTVAKLVERMQREGREQGIGNRE